MKGWFLFPFLLGVQAGFAQDLGNLVLKAEYSLVNTPEDATGNYAPMTLVNAPFAGALGVYSNGQYINGDPDSCLVWSPFLSPLFDSVFAVQLEFQPLPPDAAFRPVIVVGDTRRYLFLATIGDKFRVAVNDLPGSVDVEFPLPVSGQWYELTIIHDQLAGRTDFYLDGALVSSLDGTLDRLPTDGRLSNTHFGVGETFKGYWRNLRVYGSDAASGIPRDLASDIRIQVFPNPTNGHVHLTTNASKPLRWWLYGPDGRTIDWGILEVGEVKVDLASRHPGLYALVVQDGTGRRQRSTRIVRL